MATCFSGYSAAVEWNFVVCPQLSEIMLRTATPKGRDVTPNARQ